MKTPMKKDTVLGRVKYMVNKAKDYLRNIENEHVFISRGNKKTGLLVPSVSLIPIKDCPNCSQCCQLCYDITNDCRHICVMNTRAKNRAILQADPERYFREVSAFCFQHEQKYDNAAFRWHVGGDITSMYYLEKMVEIAEEHPNLRFLAFTKAYNIVNAYMDKHGDIPANLQIIFSVWKGLECPNPYEFPTSHIKYLDGSTTAPDDAIECSGNCSECLMTDLKCFGLKRGIPGVCHGGAIVFLIH